METKHRANHIHFDQSLAEVSLFPDTIADDDPVIVSI